MVISFRPLSILFSNNGIPSLFGISFVASYNLSSILPGSPKFYFIFGVSIPPASVILWSSQLPFSPLIGSYGLPKTSLFSLASSLILSLACSQPNLPSLDGLKSNEIFLFSQSPRLFVSLPYLLLTLASLLPQGLLIMITLSNLTLIFFFSLCLSCWYEWYFSWLLALPSLVFQLGPSHPSLSMLNSLKFRRLYFL